MIIAEELQKNVSSEEVQKPIKGINIKNPNLSNKFEKNVASLNLPVHQILASKETNNSLAINNTGSLIESATNNISAAIKDQNLENFKSYNQNTGKY